VISGFGLAAGHASMDVQAFVHHAHVARFFLEGGIVQGQPAADLDQGVLLPAHGAAIRGAQKSRRIEATGKSA